MMRLLMKFILSALIIMLSVAGMQGQIPVGSGTYIGRSGDIITIPNYQGATIIPFQEIVNGSRPQ